MGRTAYTDLLGCQRKFTPHGQSAPWVSDWLPEIATCADDIALIRSAPRWIEHVGSVAR